MDKVRKAKAQMELNLARDVKSNKAALYKDTGIVRLGQYPLLNKMGDLLTWDMEKTEVWNIFFASAFTGKTGPQQSQLPEAMEKGQDREGIPLVEEDQVRNT